LGRLYEPLEALHAALAGYTRSATFETLVGAVAFGQGGGWAHPRVLTVQFRNIERNDILEFPQTRHPGGRLSTRNGFGRLDLFPMRRQGDKDAGYRSKTLL